jgi:hypothetical protein
MANFANGTDGVLIGTYATPTGQHAAIITGIGSNGKYIFLIRKVITEDKKI